MRQLHKILNNFFFCVIFPIFFTFDLIFCNIVFLKIHFNICMAKIHKVCENAL